jgi:hypothetical protein
LLTTNAAPQVRNASRMPGAVEVSSAIRPPESDGESDR